MAKILIVDDNPNKQQMIGSVVAKVCENRQDVEILTALEIVDAKRKLEEHNIDIMILDICLPVRITEKPDKEGGIKLLREIKHASSKYMYPKYVISISEYEEELEKFSSGEGIIHESIHYDVTQTDWSEKLEKYLGIALTVLSNNVIHRNYDYDIAVICALPEELESIKKSLQEVEQCKVPYDNDIYYHGHYEIDGIKRKVVISSANQMGMVAATSLTTKMIANFIPKYVVMTGIAGGTKPDKMNFGDIIVATCAWDYRAGKDISSKEGTQHLNTINQINIDARLINYCRQLASDKNALQSIEDGFDNGKKPDTHLKLLLGPVVSGASVVTDPQIVQDVLNNQDRNVLAIEMEIYGVYYAAQWAIEPRPKYFLALKSISDFANPNKGDDYHQYASYTSAKAFEILAKQYFEYNF